MELSFYEKVSSGKELNQQELKSAIKILKRIQSRGGLVVVSENDTLITTYSLDSYSRKAASLNGSSEFNQTRY
ncbi:hypothetical protein CXF61_04885 [Psychrobacter sp. 4Dc]|uniref:hypothetical protein n=1 Tax=Psychrobacter sp. 4Dc TaxID=888437 RepID=UPI000CAE46C3|nr:hypothetical protein [Psychrobacter sp. 4Dc]PKH65730.1 hypothetical protein CXF61_04885 [Psychrobacter sp. 4Dc]